MRPFSHSPKNNTVTKWLTLLTGTTSQIVFSFLYTGIVVSEYNLRHIYGISLYDIGIQLSFLSLGVILSEIPWGMMSDKFGDKPVLLLGLSGLVISLLLFSFIRSYVVGSDINVLISLTFLSIGVFGASINSSSGRSIMSAFPPGEQIFAMSIRQTSVPIGGVIGSLYFPSLFHNAGDKNTFLLCSFLFFLCIIFVIFFVEKEETIYRKNNLLFENFFSCLKNKKIIQILITSFCLTSTQISILVFGKETIILQKSISFIKIDIIVPLILVLGAFFRIYLGKKFSLTNPTSIILIMGTINSTFLIFMVILTKENSPLACLAFILAGITSLSWQGLAYGVISKLGGSTIAGTALSLMGIAVLGASFITPAISPFIILHTSWATFWIFMAMISLIPLFIKSYTNTPLKM
ncbi:MFS transporter [Saccharibacter sp. 17.LH.SD]|uniref:MFS transporter n=1 Tax=Saccharibacter sp. 17.LH.SD TaxID=2689393 RepID=UPI00136CAB0B|nr:MFS transporter [Saccharibacter sp. 17.LH.SD]MXV45186.1 MFS transporter [Saccharibacter sp. 17.LH.SD]